MALWGCYYSSQKLRNGKINPHGGVEEVEKEVGVSQMANGSEHSHKSLLGFLFKSYKTTAQ